MAPFQTEISDLERGDSMPKQETSVRVIRQISSESDMTITPVSTRPPTRAPTRINTGSDISVVKSEGEETSAEFFDFFATGLSEYSGSPTWLGPRLKILNTQGDRKMFLHFTDLAILQQRKVVAATISLDKKLQEMRKLGELLHIQADTVRDLNDIKRTGSHILWDTAVDYLPGQPHLATLRELMHSFVSYVADRILLFILAVLAGLAVIVPILIMTTHEGVLVSLVTICISTVLFAGFVVGTTESTKQEVFGAVAAYAAVLVVCMETTGSAGPGH